ncbi:MAG TPA: hypothetical protein VGG74_21145 [Kofleriaceae bacterium]|jgi:hypothetical protein
MELDLDAQLAAARARARLDTTEAPSPGNVRGGSGDPSRGAWVTRKEVADAVGTWTLDPFSNPRSHIVCDHRCMLEDGGDGFGDGTPGMFRVGDGYPMRATADWRVWLQPPYAKGWVDRALDHYGHTRFCALLRFDPRPPWFDRVYALARFVVVLKSSDFEPPPGADDPGSTFPHALFYADPSDVTAEALRLGVSWRTRYDT